MAINKEYVPIDNEPTIKPRTVTGIFTKYIAKTLPLAFDESMSYYECLCALLDYINTKVIPALDNNAEGLLELQEFYLELQSYVNDYFKNLDVQEEINNKLDDMVEQGTLQEIIYQFLQSNAAWCYDSVADMKLAENFINGSFAQTMGYYSANDGGASLYKIRTITNEDVVDEKFIISLYDETLIAELIYDEINVKQLGAYGDNTHDDTNVFTQAFSKGNNKKIYIPAGTYLIEDELTVPDATLIYGDGTSSVLKYNGNTSGEYILKIPFRQAPQFSIIEKIKLDGNYIANGIYDGASGSGNATRLTFKNLDIYSCIIGINLSSMGSNVDNCYIMGKYTIAGGTETCTHGIKINSTDCRITNTRIYGFTQYGIYCDKSSNRIINVKTALCGTGAYFKGGNLEVVIESQENYHDNIEINTVHSSNFTINSSGAGIVKNEGEQTIPETLNTYALIKIVNSNTSIINGSLISRCAFGTENWSCEGYYINLSDCIGLDINVSTNYNLNSTNKPLVLNCDVLAGNNLIVNGIEYIDLLKRKPTFTGTSNTTLNSQSEEQVDVSIPSATGNFSLVSFPYENCTKIAFCTRLQEDITINRMTFQYYADGNTHNIFIQTNRLSLKTPYGNQYRMWNNIQETLANDETYQEYIQSQTPISNQKILINGDMTNYSGSRSNIKGTIKVYYS